MAKVLMVASEAVPFVKTGGLADVVGALAQALAAAGDEVAVLLPKYRTARVERVERVFYDLRIWLGATSYTVGIDRALRGGVPYFFIDCPPLYDRAGLYNEKNVDYPDNHIRFAVLSRTALEVVRYLFRAQVVHCHDWQAALVAPYARHLLAGDPTFLNLRLLLTIHNLGYQGTFPPSALAGIGLDSAVFHRDAMEFYGQVNTLKGGIVWSDAITTVSPTYAREIQTPEHGFGLDGLLRARSAVLSGVLNGVDTVEWNPETDRHLSKPYSGADLDGKRADKLALLAEFGLPSRPERPLIGIVSRLADQKGFDLVAAIREDLMAQDLALVALGSGDPRYEEMFRELALRYPDRAGIRIGYDDALSHRIEAGADIFLMPSRYEPCGLNQMYSLRYGTPPVVRATGGLNDTIDEETGFKFEEYTPQALMTAIRAALAAYADPADWRERVRRGMRMDFSWNRSASQYSALYRRLSNAAGVG
jgi:starch synthase